MNPRLTQMVSALADFMNLLGLLAAPRVLAKFRSTAAASPLDLRAQMEGVIARFLEEVASLGADAGLGNRSFKDAAPIAETLAR